MYMHETVLYCWHINSNSFPTHVQEKTGESIIILAFNADENCYRKRLKRHEMMSST